MIRTPWFAEVDGTIVKIAAERRIVADTQFRGFRNPAAEPGQGQGRCVALLSAPFTQVRNVGFIAGDDDALSISGDCHGSIVVGCDFTVEDWAESKGIIAYTNPDASNRAGPIYRADVGYAGQIIGNRLQGSHTSARIADGVWNILDNDIWISSLAGLDFMAARANVIGNRFRVMPKPNGAPYWYPQQPMIPVRVSGTAQAWSIPSASLFFKDNTLDGQPIDGPGLCRRIGGAPCPASIFRKTPN